MNAYTQGLPFETYTSPSVPLYMYTATTGPLVFSTIAEKNGKGFICLQP